MDHEGSCVTYDDCPPLSFGGSCYDDRQQPREATFPVITAHGNHSCDEFNSCHFTFNPNTGDYDTTVTLESCPPNRAYSPDKKKCIVARKVTQCEHLAANKHHVTCDLACLNGGECVNDECVCEHGYAGHLCAYSIYPMPPAWPRTITASPAHHSCTVSGFGNVFTFDSAFSQIRGNCEYELVRSSDFMVTVHRSFDTMLNRVSFTWATNKIYSISPTSVTFQKPGETAIDLALPYEESHIQIMRADNRIHFEINSLEVDFYLSGMIEIVIPHRYMSKVTGLCGNYNGDGADDHVNRNGKRIRQDELISLEHLARSWHHNALPSTEVNHQQCIEGEYELIETTRHQSSNEQKRICSVLYKFFACNEVIPPEPYHDACLADTSGFDYTTRSNVHCGAIEAYVTRCRLNSIDIPNWRTRTACHVSCPMSHVWQETTTMSEGICGNLITDFGEER